jgi:methyltransferase (TIGR00027 family)
VKPVSKTAYYCCGVRALDAAAARPVCGDQYAGRFMTPEAWAVFEPFRELEAPNASNVARHRMIDDLLRERLARRPDTGVVVIGAGFDTRAFRMPGGRWVELDEPAVMAVKDVELPASRAPNPLTRVSITFDGEPIAAALAPHRDLPEPIVVLEGVLPYLTDDEVRELLRALRSTFTSLTLVCDLTTRTFIRRYGDKIGAKLRELGAPYGRLQSEARGLIEAAGFRLEARDSIVGYAAALGMLRIPRWLLATLLRALRDGYTIATFVAGPAESHSGHE